MIDESLPHVPTIGAWAGTTCWTFRLGGAFSRLDPRRGHDWVITFEEFDLLKLYGCADPATTT